MKKQNVKKWQDWFDSALSATIMVSVLVWTTFYTFDAFAHLYDNNWHRFWT